MSSTRPPPSRRDLVARPATTEAGAQRASASGLPGTRRRAALAAPRAPRQSVSPGAAAEIRNDVVQQVDQLKRYLAVAEFAGLKHGGVVPAALKAEVKHAFRRFSVLIHDRLLLRDDLPQTVRDELGALIKTELLPYLLLTECAERFLSKPRGYAGDFYSIELMYAGKPGGRGILGPLFDECFLAEPAALAVRNRRALLTKEIRKVLDACPDENVQICSLASGPAAEIFDVFELVAHPERLVANLIDIDRQALAYVSDKADRLGLERQLVPTQANLVHLATGREQLSLGVGQKLVYSIGLIDYFADQFAVQLLDYIHGVLAPGGKVILGNFHPQNTSRALMEHVLDWKLIHRDEADMNRLMEASKFGRPCTEIVFEETGVNMFAACIKQVE